MPVPGSSAISFFSKLGSLKMNDSGQLWFLVQAEFGSTFMIPRILFRYYPAIDIKVLQRYARQYKHTRQRPLVTSLTSSKHLTTYLTQLLYDLEFVEESLPHHPEENALLHSLQTFELARINCDSQALIAAGLLHDIGKSQAIPGHAELGAELLRGLLPDYVVWLVAHHMDLIHDARRTKRTLRNTPSLHDLKRLRQWDLQARVANVNVCSVEFAVYTVCRGLC